MKARITAVRVLVPAVLAAGVFTAGPYPAGGRTDLLLNCSAILLLVASAMGRAWTSAFISGRKNRELITVGPYSLLRNPLYFFSLLGYVGAGLAFGSVVLALLLAAIFFGTHWPAILREEVRLEEKFGGEFRAYREAVPRFLPRRLKITDPGAAVFAPALFSRAVAENALIPGIYILALIAQWAHVHGIIPVIFRLY